MFFFRSNNKWTALVLLLLIFYLTFLLLDKNKNGSVSQFYLYQERFTPVTFSESELLRLKSTYRSSTTRIVRIPNTFNSEEVTSENLVGGFWPSGKLFIDLHWNFKNPVS